MLNAGKEYTVIYEVNIVRHKKVEGKKEIMIERMNWIHYRQSCECRDGFVQADNGTCYSELLIIPLRKTVIMGHLSKG